MGKHKVKPNYRRRLLRLPDLDHCKRAVLNSLGSPASRRVYEYAIDQFIAWYCSEPRLAFNRIVVARYRMHLESRGLAANTINQQLAAVRRLAHEAADSGLLSPELAAGISRVKGVKQLGFRSGNWLSAEQSSEVLWAVVDLIGKGGHIRTVPIPQWVKAALDQWILAANVIEGRIFRRVARAGKVWGKGISQNVVWYVVKTCCERAGLEHIAPHDLRRTCAKLCHTSGGELEQIQFLLGHASVQTTERYLGCKQNLGHPVNDLFDLRTDGRVQENGNESAPMKALDAVEQASGEAVECRHGGSEHDQPVCDAQPLSIRKRTDVVEVRKDHRPQSLRRCSQAGASRGNAGSKADGQPDSAAIGSMGPGTLPNRTP
jgi:site-specific recombinase XerD